MPNGLEGEEEYIKGLVSTGLRTLYWMPYIGSLSIGSSSSIHKYPSLYWRVEKATAPHSSTLAWKIPWMEKPGKLQSMGLLRVGHDWETSLSLFTFMHWRRKWQPTPVFLPGESQGRGSLMGCRHGVAQSWTRLKQLSSSSSRFIFKELNLWV